jgi:hypothetical protein
MSMLEVRQAVDMELERHWTGDPIPTHCVAAVLVALDGLMLLGDFEGTPEDWIAKVERARLAALVAVTDGQP